MWTSDYNYYSSQDFQFPLGMCPPFNIGLRDSLLRHMELQAAVNDTSEILKFTPLCINKPVMSLKNIDYENNCQANCYDILLKLVSTAKFNSEENIFIPILQNILDEHLHQKDILDLILDILKIFQDDFPNKLAFLEEQLLEILLPKNLLTITTNNENVKTVSLTGSGGFGDVFKGNCHLSNKTVLDVIIKLSKTPNKDIFLKNEALVMNNLNHNNIVKILAFVRHPMMIVMENLEHGDLRQYLQGNSVPVPQLYKMITDILTGMEYFSEKLYVHRDLAARNIFVDSKLVCKIGDFGLACQIKEPNGIYKEKFGTLNMYTTAPEARIFQEYSIKTDVWAIGLVMWEIFYLKDFGNTDCWKPYIQMYLNDFHYTLRPPSTKSCPKTLSDYINDHVLNMDAKKRPTFTNIKECISAKYIDREPDVH